MFKGRIGHSIDTTTIKLWCWLLSCLCQLSSYSSSVCELKLKICQMASWRQVFKTANTHFEKRISLILIIYLL